MVWVRLDDGFSEHPKVEAVGPLGLAMFVSGLCYCNRNLTDGFIPWNVVERLLPAKNNPRTVAESLIGSGLWEKRKGNGVNNGVTVHDYLDYNPSRREVLDGREAAKERQRNFKERKKLERVTRESHKSNGVTGNAPPPFPPPPPVKQGAGGAEGGRAVSAPPSPKDDAALRAAANYVLPKRAADLVAEFGPERVLGASARAGVGPEAPMRFMDALKGGAA